MNIATSQHLGRTSSMGQLIDLADMQWPRMTDEEWAEHDARIAARKAEIEREEQAERMKERAKALHEVGWPMRALDAALVADVAKPGVEIVKAWDASTKSVLVLSGQPGCGKTVAAAWWALQRAIPAAFVRAATFAATSRYDEERRKVLETSLVLDDLGAEYNDAKGSFLVDLDELVDSHYGNRRPLIITTNLDPQAFKARYGERVVDRLRECGTWKSVGSVSLRAKGKS